MTEEYYVEMKYFLIFVAMNHLKHLLSLIIVFGAYQAYAQIDLRIENAKQRIEKTEAYLPEGIELTYDQRVKLKSQHEQKIKAETALLKQSYLLNDCYMTKLVDSIVASLIAANPDIPKHTEAFIYKSSDFNAFTMGEDILFVNANLVYECRNVNELACVIAHEIAHNSLKHSANAQVRVVQLITNDSIQKAIKAAERQEYGQATALNALMLPIILNDKATSRKNEMDADSLGMAYIIAAGYNPVQGAKVHEIISYYDKAAAGQMDYSHLEKAVGDLLLSKEKYYTRSNSLGFSEKIETEWDSYLATHPYSDERIQHLHTTFQLQDNGEDAVLNSVSVRMQLYEEMSQVAFETGALSRYAYMAIENYGSSPVVARNMSFGFYVLGFLKERYLIGKYLQLQNLAQPEDYDRICYILSNCTSANFYAMGGSVKPQFNLSTSTLSQEEQIIAIIDLIKADDKGTLEIVWTQYAKELKASPYKWFMLQLEEYLASVKRYYFVKQVK